ncbi:MAG: tetratricopeptide repeat protein [Bacteroidia bacterium]
MRTILAISIFCFGILRSQSIDSLYKQKRYSDAIRLEKKAASFNPEQLYYLGFSFFQMENDEKAVNYYNKAIAKGLDEAYIYFYKGLALRYAKKNEEALAAFDEALKLEPDNQEYMSEKALVYYYGQQYDKAMEIFQIARNLPNTFYAPHYMVPHILNIKGDYAGALKGFYSAVKIIDEGSQYFVSTLLDIGRLEYTVNKNYSLSAQAYKKAIELEPVNYEIYPKLMKTYNASGEFDKADTLFRMMKTAYERKELPEDFMKYGNAPVAEWEWRGQNISVYKYFKEPAEAIDQMYKAYLLNKDADKVERTFVTEKTIKLEENGAEHLFCEKLKEGGHRTYPYGWNDSNISLFDFRKAVYLALEGKMEAAASSTTGK